MWKKPEAETNKVSQSKPTVFTPSEGTPERRTSTEQALLGQSLSLEGRITGCEDLVIEGKIKGTVDLKDNCVLVGKHGCVEGDIFARNVSIEGEVIGNLHAGEMACIHRSGYVKGNVSAPRVIVEDGARLKGSIDVDAADGAPAKGFEVAKSSSVTTARGEDEDKDKDKDDEDAGVVRSQLM